MKKAVLKEALTRFEKSLEARTNKDENDVQKFKFKVATDIEDLNQERTHKKFIQN